MSPDNELPRCPPQLVALVHHIFNWKIPNLSSKPGCLQWVEPACVIAQAFLVIVCYHVMHYGIISILNAIKHIHASNFCAI
ncbi:hypothetical protein OPV22_030838 [Ensete ventricosum]|uniref:Uncharacterized protein n=1 Tax=Ensete ventricosum TaxID=4639 RepID=A0AAV8PR91_ENSVE|nr:hypothetical protein OPV22_030838 [Ensete ventricosum]